MEDSYPLVGKLIVEARAENRRGSAWKYHIKCSRSKSVYYDPAGQDSIEGILRGAGYGMPGKALGSSFPGPAGVKEITAETHSKLNAYSASLKELKVMSI